MSSGSSVSRSAESSTASASTPRRSRSARRKSPKASAPVEKPKRDIKTSRHLDRFGFALREGRGVRPWPLDLDADPACSVTSFRNAESESSAACRAHSCRRSKIRASFLSDALGAYSKCFEISSEPRAPTLSGPKPLAGRGTGRRPPLRRWPRSPSVSRRARGRVEAALRPSCAPTQALRRPLRRCLAGRSRSTPATARPGTRRRLLGNQPQELVIREPRGLQAPLVEAVDVRAGIDQRNDSIGDLGVVFARQLDAEGTRFRDCAQPPTFLSAALATFLATFPGRLRPQTRRHDRLLGNHSRQLPRSVAPPAESLQYEEQVALNGALRFPLDLPGRAAHQGERRLLRRANERRRTGTQPQCLLGVHTATATAPCAEARTRSTRGGTRPKAKEAETLRQAAKEATEAREALKEGGDRGPTPHRNRHRSPGQSGRGRP